MIAPIADDAMPGALDPTELLGIQMQHHTRPLALVALDRWRGLYRRQAIIQTLCRQKAPDRGVRLGQRIGDGADRLAFATQGEH